MNQAISMCMMEIHLNPNIFFFLKSTLLPTEKFYFKTPGSLFWKTMKINVQYSYNILGKSPFLSKLKNKLPKNIPV